MKVVINFPIVVYPSEFDDGGAFTAHCLNMDLVADDDSIEGAISKLFESIEAGLDAAEKHSTWPFIDAPREYWDKMNGARKLPAELAERITFNANKRLGLERGSLSDDIRVAPELQAS